MSIDVEEKEPIPSTIEDYSTLQENPKKKFRLIDCCLFKIFLTGLYWSIFLGCGFGVSGISVSIKDYHQFLNNGPFPVSLSVVSLLFFIRGSGIIISGYLLGRLCDWLRNPRKWYYPNLHCVAGCGIIQLAIPLALIPFLPIWFLSLPLHILIGIGSNTILIVTTVLPKSLFNSNKITASIIQGCHFSYGAGAFIYPLIIGSSLYRIDLSPWTNILIIYYIAFVIQTIPIIICCLPTPVFDRSLLEEKKQKKLEKKGNKTGTDEKLEQNNSNPGNIEDNENHEISEISENESSSSSSSQQQQQQRQDNKEEKKDSKLRKYFVEKYNQSFIKKDIHKIREIQKEYSEEKFIKKLSIFFQYKRRQFHFIRFVFFMFIGLSMIFYHSQNKSFQNLIFLYTSNRGFDKSSAAYMNTVYFCFYSLSRFTSIFLFLVVDPITITFILETGTVVTLIVMIIFRNYDIVIWIGSAFAAMFNSPIFGALIVSSRSFGIEPTALETSVVLSCTGIGGLVPSGVSVLMGINNSLFLVCVSILAVLMITVFYIAYCLGTVLKHRKKEKEKRLLIEKLKESMDSVNEEDVDSNFVVDE